MATAPVIRGGKSKTKFPMPQSGFDTGGSISDILLELDIKPTSSNIQKGLKETSNEILTSETLVPFTRSHRPCKVPNKAP